MTAPVPETKRPWWKRKWGIAAIVVVVLLGLGAIGNAVNPPPESTASPSASTADASSPTASPPESPSAESVEPSASPSSVEPTTPSPSAPATVPTQPPAQPVLKKTAGRGDKILKFPVQDAPTVARIVAKGNDNFSVISYAGTEYGDLLVNEIGSYAGWVYVAAGVDRFKISSRGTWTVEVNPISTARPWTGADAINGKGDAVLMLSGGASGITTIKNKSSNNFAVQAFTPEGDYLDLLVNEIGSYSGEVMLPEADPMVLVVKAVGGTWSMSAITH